METATQTYWRVEGIAVGDSWGIYIPQRFCEQYPQENVADSVWDCCLKGPEEEWYWEAWEFICSTWESDGLRIEQDGDCFFIREVEGDPSTDECALTDI